MDDTTTFFLAFLATFLGLATLLLHLERRGRALEERLATLEAATTATAKAGQDDRRPPA